MNEPPEYFGVFNLNKPSGMTSRDVVNIVQRLVRPAKAGHAGTLDPMATGVLLVCVGKATRMISLLQQTAKTYVAEFRLGERSDTDDITGQVEQSSTLATRPSEGEVRKSLSSFVGWIDQTPPAFSAIHVGGRRAYEMARQGEEFALAPRKVRVDTVEMLAYEWPVVHLKIECGAGTYVRSIARDLGEALGCGGLMSALQRTRVGAFSIDDATRPDQLTADSLTAQLTPALRIADGISKYVCTEDEMRRVARGGSLELRKEQFTKVARNSEPSATDSEQVQPPVALLSPAGDQLLALGEVRRQGRKIQPRTVFN